VVELSAEELAVWRADAEQAYPKLRGSYVDPELFDEVMRLREEYRSSMLAMSTAGFLPERLRGPVRVVTYGIAVAIVGCLVWASIELVLVDYEYGAIVAWGIPVWVVSLVMPVCLTLICAHHIWHASPRTVQRVLVTMALAIPVLMGWIPASGVLPVVWLGGAAVVVATGLGMPIYAAIGGLALLLFWEEGTPLSGVPGEAYRMSTSPMLPALPLFTLAGYILAEGNSSKRLLRLFSTLVGWIPGGLAVVVTLLLAFFTPLTGASGITILAMGGLLLPLLTRANYPEKTSLGLVTVSGSIGVLFPPSLPVILYAYYADVRLERLFYGGFVPGVILVVVVAAWGAYRGWASGAPRESFSARDAAKALWAAKWEVALPIAVLVGIFGGFTTLVEAAALTVVYSLLIETVIHRELNIVRDLPRVAVESIMLVGGFMIIISVALAFTNYLIIAQVPMHALAWVREFTESPLVFLLALNVLLIVVGALMDIYSAIIVIVPLIVPIAAAYGINPVHLGVIFMANMQLGYLMPPMGENLFLAAYRFNKELPEIYAATLPYIVILLITVLLITYVPWLTLGPLGWFEN
jgi:tripartite ATP-independent transporter DctM subunit